MRYAFISLLVFLLPVAAHAAELSVTPPSHSVRAGDSFTVSVLLSTGTDSANAVEGTLAVSSNLSIIRTDTHASVISLWPEGPAVSGSTVHFAGVIPGGFRGTLSSEWVGYKPGTILTLVLSAKREGAASVSFTGASVLANDGAGTELPAKALGVNFPVLSSNGVTSVPPVVVDTTPPESFTPVVTDGAPFGISGTVIVFSAVDKHSDIVGYEVAHSRDALSDSDAAHLEWKRAVSPYALSSSEAGEYHYIKAVDAYGNERIERVLPVGIVPEHALPWLILIGGAVLLAALAVWLVRRKNK